jgi:hypothetical protein
MKTLWNKEQEIDFFRSSRRTAIPEQLFYRSDDKRYLAYRPKRYEGEKTTLQSRNAFIGNYTEKWRAELLKDFADRIKGHIVQDVICEEIGLTQLSPADVALCKTKDAVQKAENIILLLEIKMSVAWTGN